MKYKIEITIDDEAKEAELVMHGKRYELVKPTFTIDRPPVNDEEAERNGHGYQILKKGPIITFSISGTIVSEEQQGGVS